MAKVLIYYAHPGHKHSNANRAMLDRAKSIDDIGILDLYATYPRFDINIDREQRRLLEVDVVVIQCPLFWYSTPALIKEWEDLVLEHGFAYGEGGDKLAGKKLLLAVTAAGPEEAYTPEGYQHYPIRTFLTPLEQTARLCHMQFVPPLVLYASLKAPGAGKLEPHVRAYGELLEAIRDDRFDFEAVAPLDVLTSDNLRKILEH